MTDTTPTTPSPLTRTTSNSSQHRIEKRLAHFYSNSPKSSCGCGSAHCACGSSCRCGRDQVGNGQAQGCGCAGSPRARGQRRRRNAEYGTLETIDEGSLNALRKEYKLGLKEITLSPDEDPAEALMRYNAASIREALERASQEPLEINGDPLTQQEEAELAYARSEQPAFPTTTPATLPAELPKSNTEPPPPQDAPSSDRDAMSVELSATRVEFKKLYSLIESLKEQLTKAEQRLRDCQHADVCNAAASTTSTTPPPASSSTSSSTTSTSISSTTESPKHWAQLLASRGYDTNYLSKSNEQQYAHCENLDLPKPESNSSGDYSYQELQPYDPDNKSKRATALSTTTSSSTSIGSSTERSNVARLLNAALHSNAIGDVEGESAGDDAATVTATTPTPYALRGKFVRRRSTRLGVRTTRQAKVTMPREQVGASSSKLDQLIDVLHKLLRLQLQRDNALAKLSSSTSNASATKRPSTKRLRRRRKQRKSTSTKPSKMHNTF